MLLPIFGITGIICIYPMAYAVIVGLHKTRYLAMTKYIGIGNYWKVITDPRVQHSILVSLKYIFGTLSMSIPLGLVLAIVLARPLRFNAVFRAILITPWVISQVAAAMLWMWLLQPEYGPVNYLLRQWGGRPVFFLEDPRWALPTLILVNSWISFPFAMVLLLAAVQTIPIEIREAAQLDGATNSRVFWSIVLPFILNTFLIVIIIIALRTFNMVTLIFTLTGGGPIDVTHTLSFKIFQDAFLSFRISRASVLGVVMFLMNIMFSAAYITILKREAVY